MVETRVWIQNKVIKVYKIVDQLIILEMSLMMKITLMAFKNNNNMEALYNKKVEIIMEI